MRLYHEKTGCFIAFVHHCTCFGTSCTLSSFPPFYWVRILASLRSSLYISQVISKLLRIILFWGVHLLQNHSVVSLGISISLHLHNQSQFIFIRFIRLHKDWLPYLHSISAWVWVGCVTGVSENPSSQPILTYSDSL